MSTLTEERPIVCDHRPAGPFPARSWMPVCRLGFPRLEIWLEISTKGEGGCTGAFLTGWPDVGPKGEGGLKAISGQNDTNGVFVPVR